LTSHGKKLINQLIYKVIKDNYTELELLMWKAENLNLESIVHYDETHIKVRPKYLHVDRGLLSYIITWDKIDAPISGR